MGLPVCCGSASPEDLFHMRLELEHELLAGQPDDEQHLRKSVDWLSSQGERAGLGWKQVTPQTIAATVHLLQDEDAIQRQQAASTLSILASRSIFNQFRIGSQPGAVSGLVALLQDEQSWVRGSAVAALTHLAMNHYVAMQTHIGQEPGAIASLVQLLHDHESGLGCAAALALKTLADQHPRNQTLIGQHPGAVQGLVVMVYEGDGAIQTMAHAALQRLAANHPVNRAKIRHVAMMYDGQWPLEGPSA